MITIAQLAEGFALNLRLIKRQTAGLSHADSLLQTPYNINTLNWVLGHIAVSRDRVLRLVGAETLLDEDQASRYETGSDPITRDGPHVLPLEELLEILTIGQSRIEAAFENLTEFELAREVEVGERSVPVGTRLHGLYFHDTYHTGQTDLLRQVAGANDKII